MTHTQFRVLDRTGKQVDIVTRGIVTGWRSAKTGMVAASTSTILGWHGRKARLAALVARIEAPLPEKFEMEQANA